MKLLICSLLVTVISAAQSDALKFKIDSVATDDSYANKRVYRIQYHVENLTTNRVSFFLKPHSLIANAASSMTLFPVYRIYQNGVRSELDGPFFESNSKSDFQFLLLNTEDPVFKEKAKAFIAKSEEKLRLTVENYKKKGGKSDDQFWIYKNQDLLESQQFVDAKSSKSFVIETVWNKNRYFKEDNLEYYFDKNDVIEIEITFELKKSLFKNEFSPEEFDRFMKDKNCIQGNFKTNKIQLNFKD